MQTSSHSFCRTKIGRADAAWYVVFQVLRALAAPYAVVMLIGDAFRDDLVLMATTAPGPMGAGWAFGTKLAITFAFVLFIFVKVDNWLMRGALLAVVGLLISAFIPFESPLFGMSMNLARTFGSALAAK